MNDVQAYREGGRAAGAVAPGFEPQRGLRARPRPAGFILELIVYYFMRVSKIMIWHPLTTSHHGPVKDDAGF